MNPRTTGLLLLVALGLGAFIYLYEVPHAEPAPAGPDGGMLFPSLDADRVDWLSLTTEDGVAVELARDGGVWEGVAPRPFRADQSTVDAMVRQLAQLEIEGRVEQPAGEGDAPSVELADFGLGDAFNTIRWRAGGAQYGLRVGRRTPVGSNTYITRLAMSSMQAGQDPIVYVSTWRVNALRKTWLDLRDRRVLDFDHTLVSDITARWPGGTVRLARRDGAWRITAPIDARADEQTVETLLSDLAFLQADGFLDDEAPVESAEPLDALGFAVELRGGEGLGDGTAFRRALQITGTRDGKRIAEREGGLRFLISQERLDELPRSLLAYRYKRLADFEIADARRFSLVYTDAPASDAAAETAPGTEVSGELEAAGWRTAPEAMAPARVGVMLAQLGRLEAREIVADALGEAERGALGLRPPRLEVRVFGEADVPLARVLFGRFDPERGVFAARSDDGVVYRVAPDLVDWLPLNTSALRDEFLDDGVEDADDLAAPEWAEGEDMPVDRAVDDAP